MGFLDELKKYKVQFIRAKKNGELSEHTIRHYETGFKFFFKYLEVVNKKKKNNLTPTDLDEDFFYDFLDWLSKNNGEQLQSTKRAYLIRIGVFLRYASKKSNGSFDFRGTLEDVKVKVPKIERRALSPEERKRLIEYFSYLEGCTEPTDVQKTIIAKLLFCNGIRAIELRGLRVSDFELSDGAFEYKVMGKGNKERRLYIGEEIIKQELSVLAAHGKTFICATKTGKPMCHSQLWRLTKRIFEEAMIDETGVHIFRHTFARTLVDKEVNLITIMELLGHGDIKTTQIYTKSNEGAKRKAVLGAF